MYNRRQDFLGGDTMGYHFLPCEREQLYLLPPALQDWLPEGDLTWFLLDAVAQMNLTAMKQTYRADGWGQAAYEPTMMVALLLYAYCLGERSSRRIERLCQRDVAFRVITANQGPDHTTIARFRQTHETELAKLFTQVLRLCAEAGLVKVGIVVLDGTKIKANAALASNRTVETIAAEVSRMLTEAQATDAAEDRQYGAELARRRTAGGLAGSAEPAGAVTGVPRAVDAGGGDGHRAAAGQARDTTGRRGRHGAEEARAKTEGA
jgi:transposase